MTINGVIAKYRERYDAKLKSLTPKGSCKSKFGQAVSCPANMVGGAPLAAIYK